MLLEGNSYFEWKSMMIELRAGTWMEMELILFFLSFYFCQSYIIGSPPIFNHPFSYNYLVVPPFLLQVSLAKMTYPLSVERGRYSISWKKTYASNKTKQNKTKKKKKTRKRKKKARTKFGIRN